MQLFFACSDTVLLPIASLTSMDVFLLHIKPNVSLKQLNITKRIVDAVHFAGRFPMRERLPKCGADYIPYSLVFNPGIC